MGIAQQNGQRRPELVPDQREKLIPGVAGNLDPPALIARLPAGVLVFEILRGLNPALNDIETQTMVSDGLTAPLHPGAERYYRERGWLD